MREIMRNPQAMGAVKPSSKFLARELVRQVADLPEGIIVELGAGTGVVTQALLDAGIAAERLRVIEQSPQLYGYLRNRFKNVRIIEGDATKLHELLGSEVKNVVAIVSSLPLRSLPLRQVKSLSHALEKIMKPNDLFVQFTYSRRIHYPYLSDRLRCIRSKFIWKNMPPARVDVFMIN
ncbi:MAG: rRNA adenine N-6-methyltransferase family protein [Gammaproteobacteria bacterium]